MASVALIQLFDATAITSTTTASSKTLEATQVDFIAWLDISVNDGATTVDVDIEHSADNSSFVVAASFTQVVNSTGQEAINISKLLPYARAKITLAGTPSATVKVSLYFDKRK